MAKSKVITISREYVLVLQPSKISLVRRAQGVCVETHHGTGPTAYEALAALVTLLLRDGKAHLAEQIAMRVGAELNRPAAA